MRRPKLSILLLLALLAAGALTIGAELFLRQREARSGARSGMAALYYPHKRVHRAFVRGARFGDRVHVNRYGFRGPEPAVEKAPGTTRIMAFGASATFDPCAARDSEAWPARLEHWLNQQAPGRRFEVLNTAVPQLIMLDNIIRLQTELYALKPDVILLYAGHGSVGRDELDRMSRTPRTGAPPGPAMPEMADRRTPWGDWLTRNTLLYPRIAQRLGISADPPSAPVADSTWQRGMEYTLDEFRRDLTSFVLIARSLGTRVVLVELSHRNGAQSGSQLTAEDRAVWNNNFVAPPPIIVDGFPKFSDIQRSVADSNGAEFVATRPWVVGDANYCPGDPIHLNRAGADTLARRLSSALLAGRSLR